MAVDFVTFADLRRFTDKMTLTEQSILKSEAAKPAKKDTFLSYSSKDAEYLPGVIQLLENHGASVYCDLADESLPSTPNPETASLIKSQIGGSRRLVMFVTVNSKDSKWVPWEMGIGDAKLTPTNVALLPAARTDAEQLWARQEYLGLYRHIVHGKMTGEPKLLWMVYDHRSNSATRLRDWCRS